MALLHVTITGRDPRHLTDLMAKHRVVIVGHRRKKTGNVVVDAYVPPRKVVWLEKRGYAIEVLEDVETAAKQRQRENHETAETRLRRGHYADVFWGGGYLTTDEIEQAMVIGETNHGPYLERIALPHRTWEKRRCHAVRIGNRRGKMRAGICFIGGVHGREWRSFRNAQFDGKRGLIHDDLYREYMPASDERRARALGEAFADAVCRVRGRVYRVEQGVGLYPTAGTTDDYAYSRHFVDPDKANIAAFTLEWGRVRASTPFHPPSFPFCQTVAAVRRSATVSDSRRSTRLRSPVSSP